MRGLIILAICSEFVYLVQKYYGELKENWMKISLKHKMMHNFKRLSPGLHYISYYTTIEWQAGRKLLGMHNHGNK